MKKRILWVVIALAAVLVLVGMIPFSRDIHYEGTDFEFSLSSDGAVAEHDILIDGTYSSSFLLKDRFRGTFYVSDVEGLLEGTEVAFVFEPTECYQPLFHDESWQPHSSEIALIAFDKNFEQLAVMFTSRYEKTDDGIIAGYSQAESNFLVIGAKNKEEALNRYTRMLEERS